MDERDEVFRLMKEIEDASEIIPPKYAQDARIMMNYEAYKIGSWMTSRMLQVATGSRKHEEVLKRR